MIEDIYHNYGVEFIETFENSFADNDGIEKLSQEEILNRMDVITDSKASKWIKIMEGKSD